MGERVLVTGGAGFIGSHLVDALLARGHRVRVLDNLVAQAHPTGRARHLSSEAELVHEDLRERAAVDRALDGISTVFHLGGMVGNGQSMVELRLYTDANVVGTATLLEGLLARRGDIRRLVVASSMVVYGDGAYACPKDGPVPEALRTEERLRAHRWEPVCPRCGAEVQPVATREDHPLRPTSTYGVSKQAQEELALVFGRAYRIPTVALRYLNVYGSRQALSNPYTGVAAIMATRLLNDRAPTVFEDGGQRRDLLHVSDAVACTIAAADAPEQALYQAYNVGTGRSITILDLARLLARTLGKPIDPEVTGEFREGDIRHCFADVSRAKGLLGWEARVMIAEGISELAAWAAGERPEDRTSAANDELRRQGILR
jgi:dTDP-L-rhamnose 4-epimerase